MRVRRIGVLLVVAAIVLAPRPGRADSDSDDHAVDRPFGLADVRSVHVANMGSGRAAQESRRAVEDELRAAGFEIAEEAEDGDALLTGLAVTESSGQGTVVLFKSVALIAPGGAVLWHTKLRPSGRPERQGRRIARALREKVKRAVWDASREISP